MENIEQEKPPRLIDMFSQDVEDTLRSEGKTYRRKIKPLSGVITVSQDMTVETRLADGTLESVVDAHPGDRVVTGSAGERFVVTKDKFDSLYQSDGHGGYIPYERRVLAMKNPFHESISIIAPWSTADKIEYQDGSPEAILVACLDDAGRMTQDRYLIGNETMLLNVYEVVEQ